MAENDETASGANPVSLKELRAWLAADPPLCLNGRCRVTPKPDTRVTSAGSMRGGIAWEAQGTARQERGGSSNGL